MGCKMIAAITWTQVELKGLLEDEESRVNYERAKRHLGLHPFHLTDLNAALREILTSHINSYDSKLKGIILAYKNPKLLSRMGTVLYDTCYIHVDIEADFYVFRPSVGDTLKGIVNKKSQDHVGILVHKTFNATIPRPDNDDDWPGYSIHIGQEIRFTVTCLDFKDRLPYIRGSMDAQDYLRGCRTFDETFGGGTKKVDVKPKKSKFLYDDDDVEPNADQETGVDYVDHSTEEKASHKTSKKLKRESSEDVVRVKSKKKHKVEAEALPSEDEPSSYERNTSDVRDGGSSEGESSPGKLKLKREISEDKIATKKKKKKSKVKAEVTLSETEYEAQEASRRNLEEVGIIEEDVLPKKAKKLKKEKTEDKIRSKTKTKTEHEVEIIESEGDSDFYKPNESRKTKDVSGEGKIRKKHRIKTEVLSSETESELNNAKQSKRMKVESNDERSSKKYKVKAEAFLSDDESFVNEGKQSVRNKRESIDEKSTKKHRIKAEIPTAKSDD